MPVTPGALHIDHYLTNISVAYAQDQANFIASKVFPRVPVQNRSDKYAIYPPDQFYRDDYKQRPLGERPGQTSYTVEQGTYFCEEDAVEHKIDDRVRENADQPLDPDRAAMRLLVGQGLVHADRMWSAEFFTTGVWGDDWAGVDSSPSGNEFLAFDQSDSDPIEFFDQRREVLGSATGFWPNTLVLGPAAFRAIKNNPLVLERIKYTQRGMVSEDLLASLLEVDQVLVARSVWNSAHEGQTADIGFIAQTDAALLVYAAPDPAIDTPSGGYTFTWSNLIPGATNELGAVIERGREELAHSDIFQGRMAIDPSIVAPALGEFYTACSSS